MNFRVTCLLILSLLLLLPTAVLAQQGVTAFNYQGQIFDAGGQPVTGQCDFSFQIYDTVDSPTALATLQIDDLSVADGLFSVSIDFGPDVFDTSPRWLETAVRCESDPDFDSLGRQQILSVPYATYAYGVDWANVKNRPEYTVGPGLTLTGTEFSIPAAFQLPHDCADNEIPKWSGSSWACAVDSNSDTLVTLSCEVGQVAEWRANGWACSTPSGEGTTYTAGVGLSLTGTQFSIPIPYQLPQGCAAGERASWTGSRWACTRTVDAYTKAEVDTALTGKIDATEVYTTAEINSWLAAVQADLAGKIDGTDVYTTSQVDSLLERRADISHTHTAVATATVALAVDWGDIINVPAGLADGTDDSDDLVSWSEISGIVGTGATDVARGNHTHTYADPTNGTGVYLEYKPNNIACMSNQVLKWDAAGSRWVCGNASGGDITGVTAGSGLTGGGASGSVTLGADFAGTGNASTVARSDHSHNSDYYTQSQVDTVLAGKIDGTEVYTIGQVDSQIATVQTDLALKIDASEVYTTGQVDTALAQKLDAADHTWSGLSGVPAGLADGTDNTDDTVSWSEINGIVGTDATNVAGGNHNHDADYYTHSQVDTALATKIDGTEVYTIGEIDSQMATVQADLATKIDAAEVYTAGQVDAVLAQKLDASDHTWNGLSGIPAGLADGTDNTDDTVSWSEISGIVGTGATDVAGGSHNHDAAYVDEGQTDSITSAMITDGSVTSSDLQDGAALAEILDDDGSGSGLDADKLDGQDSSAFATSSHNHDGDYYTQGQVDTALALKIDSTEVYTTGQIDSQMATVQADLVTKIDASEVYTTGQVDAALAQKLDASDHTWSGLLGVPSGFSDDTDDTNDTVSWSEISGIVGTGLTNVAGGSHNHDTAYVNEGQTDSITSAMVTDGSITSADLQDGAALSEILDDDGSGSGLDADKLDGQSSSAFATSSHNHDTDYYTQGQVDTALALKIDGTEVYTTGEIDSQMATVQADLVTKIDASEVYTTGQVDAALVQKLDASAHTWSGLAGVPAGFSDDTDDTDDTVSWSEISGIVGKGATSVAGGSHNHDTAYVNEGQTDSITSAMVTDGSITSADLQDGAALAEILDDDGSGSGLDADQLDGQDSSYYWGAGGNAATAGDFIGTTNSEPLVFKTNDLVGLRIDQGAGTATDAPAVVGGYSGNTYSTGATIAGGGRSNAINRATGGYSFVGGGLGNAALEAETTIGGGYGNTVGSGWSTIGGGESNTVNADWSFIGGGFSNQVAGGGTSVVAGGATNSASGAFSFVGGGESNTVSGDYSVVAGGYQNVLTSTANYASVGGGRDNQASGSYAVIGGGNGNTASSGSSTVGGGTGNVASSSSATVSGGQSNTASGGSSAIGGGQSNTASANWGTVSGGYNNTVSSSYSTIGGGFGNQISSTGLGAAIPGGLNNAAPGATSFAAGRQAKANHDGTFVWGDSTSADIASNAGNSVTFRASGGYRLFTNSTASTGASLAAGGGSWASMSDRNQKENLQPVDTQAVLEQVGQLPLSTWNYISQDDDIRHIGPMAQDFHATFGVGENETTITAIDGDGVSLAAIQALYERVKALEAENEALKTRLDALETAMQ